MTAVNTDPVAISPSSRVAWERAKRSIGGGVSSGLRGDFQPYPIFVDRAQGPLMWDLDGREFIDYIGAWGPMLLGHSHPDVIAAVAEELPRLQMPGTGHVLEYEAAEAVLGAVPGAEKLLWSNTGTEAVQVALRLARAWSGRNHIVKFTRAYHGWHDSVFASVAEHGEGTRAVAHSKGQNPRVLDDLIVLPFNDTEQAAKTLARAAELDIAAVLIDPILNSGGGVEPDPEFLAVLRQTCTEHGVVLIFDEVVSGFRVARGGAAERWGVTPDLWTLGKALAAGFSQSAVLGRAEIIDQVTVDVYHAGTYNGNPVALAAVKAAMHAYSSPGVYDSLEENAAHLENGVAAAAERTGAPFGVHRVASIMWVYPTRGDDDTADALAIELAARGILLLPRGEMFVSMAHTREVVDRTIVAFEDAFAAVSASNPS
ncbi:aspartate aminotransferase family protein [Nocardioides sp. CER19]|uniref:aspartate aminotransferase family protein n=1 Tax=Nocardioides sp. CER19 TaxID=3038538 RepID=UPI0024482610|nr:aspartate aminotransferase family protein [Nocardioides sp. CER19]MDH2416146.1 aspartate aminotransferase family protein [Nocardioides sp. CER19]